MCGVVRVVTGGGKTVFSYLCLTEFFAEYPDGRAIIVVPTLALLDQWCVDICEATDVEPSEVACYSGGSRPEIPARINIVVLNTARRVSKQLSDLSPTFLVVDECHRAGAVENSRALEGCHEATLGLSATPERESDDGFESRVAPVLGPIIHVYDYPEAKADGVIVDFVLTNIEVSVGTDDVERIPVLADKAERLARAHSEGQSQRRASRKASTKIARSAEHAMRVPWATKLALSHRPERVIIFHEAVAAVRRITDLLHRSGQNAVAYHSFLSDPNRRDNLRLFRRGIINMLVTCRALDEGANVPEANVAIIAQSTSSTRQRIQRLGRILRPAAGKDHAVVYTLYNGPEEQRRLSDEAVELDGVAEVLWRRGIVQ